MVDNLESLRKDFEKIKKNASTIDKKLEQLRELRDRTKRQRNIHSRLAKENKPSNFTKEEFRKKYAAWAKEQLVRNIDSSNSQVTEDFRWFIDYFRTLIISKLKPSVSVTDNWVGKVSLLDPMRRQFGQVNEWFRVVQQAREAGGFGGAVPEWVRMWYWQSIYDLAHGGPSAREEFRKSEVKAMTKEYHEYMTGQEIEEAARAKTENRASLYQKTMQLRESALSSGRAPFWYFFEFGNEEFAGGKLNPYPRYPAPKLISKTEAEANNRMNQSLADASAQNGAYYRRIVSLLNNLLEEIKKLIEELEKEEVIDWDRFVQDVDQQLQHGNRILEVDLDKIDDEFYRVVLRGILEGQDRITRGLYQYSAGQIYRLRVKELRQSFGLSDVGIDDVGLSPIGL